MQKQITDLQALSLTELSQEDLAAVNGGGIFYEIGVAVGKFIAGAAVAAQNGDPGGYVCGA